MIVVAGVAVAGVVVAAACLQTPTEVQSEEDGKGMALPLKARNPACHHHLCW